MTTIDVNNGSELPTYSDTVINQTIETNNNSDPEMGSRRTSEPSNSSPVISESSNNNASANDIMYNKLISFSEELDKMKIYIKQSDDRVRSLESHDSIDLQLSTPH